MFRKFALPALCTGAAGLQTYALGKLNEDRLNTEYKDLKKEYPKEEPALRYHHLGLYGGYHQYERQRNTEEEHRSLSLS
jgi:hypothetical protein